MSKPVPKGITTPKGFYAAATTAGIKPSGLPDLTAIVADRPCRAAGVFTKSRTVGAPVIVNKRHLRGGKASAVVVNSGNANASTGKLGEANAITMCRLLAEAVAAHGPGTLKKTPLQPRDVLVASTGIIGRQLPMDKIETGIHALAEKLARSDQANAEAARAIITTDLVIKHAYRKLTIAGKTVHLAGICKGSGMIAPNMGTMLAFMTTDADITGSLLNEALQSAAAASFNRISVDQHTSPSDMALVLASGAAGHRPITAKGKNLIAFTEALTELCRDLAYQIVKDGEGATRVFRVRIVGAKNEKEADLVGKAIVDSPLVKTAIHGADPNWGRIVTAAGYSGAAIQPAKMSLTIGENPAVCVYDHGTPNELSQTDIHQLTSIMKQKEVVIQLDLGRGGVGVEWLGCDLSRQYITINADYTT